MEVSRVRIKKVKIGNRVLSVEGEADGERIVFSNNEMRIIPEDIERVSEFEVFWEGVASAMRKAFADFMIEKERILSIWRRYVKWWLKGRGEKDTIEGRSDGLYTLFSRSDEISRRVGAVYAFKGFNEELKKNVPLETLNVLFKWASGFLEEKDLPRDFVEFYNEMTKILREEDLYFEDLLKAEAEAKEVVEIVEGIAAAYRQKAVLLAAVISGRKSLAALKEEIVKNMVGEEGLILESKNLNGG